MWPFRNSRSDAPRRKTPKRKNPLGSVEGQRLPPLQYLSAGLGGAVAENVSPPTVTAVNAVATAQTDAGVNVPVSTNPTVTVDNSIDGPIVNVQNDITIHGDFASNCGCAHSDHPGGVPGQDSPLSIDYDSLFNDIQNQPGQEYSLEPINGGNLPSWVDTSGGDLGPAAFDPDLPYAALFSLVGEDGKWDTYVQFHPTVDIHGVGRMEIGDYLAAHGGLVNGEPYQDGMIEAFKLNDASFHLNDDGTIGFEVSAQDGTIDGHYIENFSVTSTIDQTGGDVDGGSHCDGRETTITVENNVQVTVEQNIEQVFELSDGAQIVNRIGGPEVNVSNHVNIDGSGAHENGVEVTTDVDGVNDFAGYQASVETHTETDQSADLHESLEARLDDVSYLDSTSDDLNGDDEAPSETAEAQIAATDLTSEAGTFQYDTDAFGIDYDGLFDDLSSDPDRAINLDSINAGLLPEWIETDSLGEVGIALFDPEHPEVALVSAVDQDGNWQTYIQFAPEIDPQGIGPIRLSDYVADHNGLVHGASYHDGMIDAFKASSATFGLNEDGSVTFTVAATDGRLDGEYIEGFTAQLVLYGQAPETSEPGTNPCVPCTEPPVEPPVVCPVEPPVVSPAEPCSGDITVEVVNDVTVSVEQNIEQVFVVGDGASIVNEIGAPVVNVINGVTVTGIESACKEAPTCNPVEPQLPPPCPVPEPEPEPCPVQEPPVENPVEPCPVSPVEPCPTPEPETCPGEGSYTYPTDSFGIDYDKLLSGLASDDDGFISLESINAGLLPEWVDTNGVGEIGPAVLDPEHPDVAMFSALDADGNWQTYIQFSPEVDTQGVGRIELEAYLAEHPGLVNGSPYHADMIDAYKVRSASFGLNPDQSVTFSSRALDGRIDGEYVEGFQVQYVMVGEQTASGSCEQPVTEPVPCTEPPVVTEPECPTETTFGYPTDSFGIDYDTLFEGLPSDSDNAINLQPTNAALLPEWVDTEGVGDVGPAAFDPENPNVAMFSAVDPDGNWQTYIQFSPEIDTQGIGRIELESYLAEHPGLVNGSPYHADMIDAFKLSSASFGLNPDNSVTFTVAAQDGRIDGEYIEGFSAQFVLVGETTSSGGCEETAPPCTEGPVEPCPTPEPEPCPVPAPEPEPCPVQEPEPPVCTVPEPEPPCPAPEPEPEPCPVPEPEPCPVPVPPVCPVPEPEPEPCPEPEPEPEPCDCECGDVNIVVHNNVDVDVVQNITQTFIQRETPQVPENPENPSITNNSFGGSFSSSFGGGGGGGGGGGVSGGGGGGGGGGSSVSYGGGGGGFSSSGGSGFIEPAECCCAESDADTTDAGVVADEAAGPAIDPEAKDSESRPDEQNPEDALKPSELGESLLRLLGECDEESDGENADRDTEGDGEKEDDAPASESKDREAEARPAAPVRMEVPHPALVSLLSVPGAAVAAIGMHPGLAALLLEAMDDDAEDAVETDAVDDLASVAFAATEAGSPKSDAKTDAYGD